MTVDWGATPKQVTTPSGSVVTIRRLRLHDFRMWGLGAVVHPQGHEKIARKYVLL